MSTKNRWVVLISGIPGVGKSSFCRSFARARSTSARYVSFDAYLANHPLNQKPISPKGDVDETLVHAVTDMKVWDDFVHHVEIIEDSYIIIDINIHTIRDGTMRFLADFDLWRRLAPSYVLFVTDEPARIRRRRMLNRPDNPESSEQIRRIQNRMLALARAVMDWFDIKIIECSFKNSETFRRDL